MPAVVVGLEVGDADFGVEQGDPLVHVQALVADPVVERLDEPVTPRFTGRYVLDADLVLAKLSKCFGNEFDLEPFLTPNAMHSFLVDHMTLFISKVGPCPPVTLPSIVGFVGPRIQPVA